MQLHTRNTTSEMLGGDILSDFNWNDEAHEERAMYERTKGLKEALNEAVKIGGVDYHAKSDEDMEEWIKSLDKPIEEEILKEKLMRMRYNSWFGLNPVEKGGTNYHAKQDYGKAKLSLVPRRIIWDVAAIREYGNNKYPDGGPDNWRGVEPERYRDAAYRHFLRYLDDPKGVDSESGLPHLWHLATNIAFLCELEDEMINKGEM